MTTEELEDKVGECEHELNCGTCHIYELKISQELCGDCEYEIRE